jgi:hypothetical protein
MPPLISNWIECIAFDCHNNIYLGFLNGILYSSNFGESWTQIFTTTTLSVHNILISDDYIYAMPYEDRYIYCSSNQGVSWFQLGSGLENKNVSVLTRNATGSLYCGTLNHGIFKGLESLISVSPISSTIPRQYKLYNNYPNPFNPQTRIRFDVPEESFININIYNSVGQLVDVLVQQNYKPGQYEIEWNAENYASGIYFCNFRAKNYNQTNKLILIK